MKTAFCTTVIHGSTNHKQLSVFTIVYQFAYTSSPMRSKLRGMVANLQFHGFTGQSQITVLPEGKYSHCMQNATQKKLN